MSPGEERRHIDLPGSCNYELLAEQPTGHEENSRGADDADEVVALELPVHILVAGVSQRVDPLEPRVICQQLGDARPAMQYKIVVWAVRCHLVCCERFGRMICCLGTKRSAAHKVHVQGCAYHVTRSGEETSCSRFRWSLPLASGVCGLDSVMYSPVTLSLRTTNLLPPPGIFCTVHRTQSTSVWL